MTDDVSLVDRLTRDLPILGVGASLSFGVEPDPLALARADGGPDFIEYAGAVEPGPVLPSVRHLHELGVPVLYHPSCLNLCGPWPNPRSWVATVDRHVQTVSSAWLAQDVSVCFVGDKPGYSIQLGYFVPPERTEAGLAEAIERVREVRDHVGVPLLLEPPPASFRWGGIPMLTWLDRLCAATGCGMLLDAGHVLSHQVLESTDLLETIDLRRVFEVHVAGGILHQTPAGVRYQDAHELPIQPEVWAVFLRLLKNCPNLKAVCVECEGAAAHTVLPVLSRVRQAVSIHAASEGLRARVRSKARDPVPDVVPAPAHPPSAAAPRSPTHYPALIRLLFDSEARARWAVNPDAVASELGLPDDLVRDVDPDGLALDADGRAQYLMSAICRSFPLSSAILGARPRGRAQLEAFLMSPSLFASLGQRTEAFGAHLQRLATLSPDNDAKVQQATLAVLDFELALASNAAGVRAAVRGGRSVPPPKPPVRAERRRGVLEVPAHTVVVELPHPMATLKAALDGLTAADAWHRIARGAVERPRLEAVLRSAPSPVTILARAHAAGVVVERGGAGGVAPLVDVSQRTVELRGRKGRWIQSVVGERWSHLPPAQKGLAGQLLDAGVLSVR